MISASAALTGSYDYSEVAKSVLIAIVASYAALDLAARVTAAKGGIRLAWLSGGAIAMGLGIWAMHHIGMAAMRLPAITRYSPLLVTCSILLAILFSLVALLFAFDLREETRWSVPRRLTSATVMGVAVSAMHYTGMAGASFVPASPPDLSHAVSIPLVGNSAVAIAAVLVVLAGVTTSSVERRQSEHRLRLV